MGYEDKRRPRKDVFSRQILGDFVQPDEKVNKAMEHERSFGKKQESDIIKKRMDSDLFKGGLS